MENRKKKWKRFTKTRWEAFNKNIQFNSRKPAKSRSLKKLNENKRIPEAGRERERNIEKENETNSHEPGGKTFNKIHSMKEHSVL